MWVYTILSAKLFIYGRFKNAATSWTIHGRTAGHYGGPQREEMWYETTKARFQAPLRRLLWMTGRSPQRSQSRQSVGGLSGMRSEWRSQGAATLSYPVQSLNRRTDALSAKICVRRHTVFIAIVINVASAGTNYGKRRTPCVNSPNTTVHAMEAWTRSWSIAPLILNLYGRWGGQSHARTAVPPGMNP